MHERLQNIVTEVKIRWRTRRYSKGAVRSGARKLYREVYSVNRLDPERVSSEYLEALSDELNRLVTAEAIVTYGSVEMAEKRVIALSDNLQEEFKRTGDIKKREEGYIAGNVARLLRNRINSNQEKHD